MTSLLTSLFQTIQGLINSILALLAHLLNLIKTLLVDTFKISEGVVEGVFRNLPALLLLGAAFVGYVMYQQRQQPASVKGGKGRKKIA
ncbi:hypothetical protein BCR35DRAFT_333169 [Leucosporidium creatinivorum]|uniref:Uncharacterized protein n=1 Tax=Leucosporidium creatinivorum TaxID=106004 RepID=A0A1Y2EX25_9BASI|nr:hypothetical protein BCR35DRAFT_333169 [Leucosporidium creatinivorum]